MTYKAMTLDELEESLHNALKLNVSS